MIYVTGDCHGDWTKLTNLNGKLDKEDYVIVCGDFGLWHNDKDECKRFKRLEEQNFTVLFVDGNHENFDRLYSDEFEVVEFCGGKAHKIRDNIYHLMRGYVFTIDNKKIFAFGGASSHDIQDGILEPSNYSSIQELLSEYNQCISCGQMVRINHISWWKQEMPNDEEMEFGMKTLADTNYNVDYIITHCAPQSIAAMISMGMYKADKLTKYLNEVTEKTKFKRWFFGHYHNDRRVTSEYHMLYNDIVVLEGAK